MASSSGKALAAERPPASLAAAFGVCALVGLLLAGPSLTWPMAFDDLVLLRSFTTREILNAFHDQWDPERLMIRGFRPGSLLFNHLRYTLFGENVVAHRLFLVALYALYSALFAELARQFGLTRRWALAASVLAMTMIYSTFHYVWITDGNHMIQGLAFVSSLWLLVCGLAERRWSLLGASLLTLLLGLITREDTLAAVPALLILGYTSIRHDSSKRRTWAAFAGLVVAMCVGLLRYRSFVVPRAQKPGTNVAALLESMWYALNPMGVTAFNWWSHLLILSWWLGWVLLAAVLLRHWRRVRWNWAAVWAICAALACSPALNVRRDDLMFFPASFMAAAFCVLIAGAVRCSRVGMFVGISLLSLGVLGGAAMSRIFAENFHPRSLRAIWWNGRYVYGAYSAKANIPEPRRTMVVDQLASARIHDERMHLNRTPRRVQEAILEGRRRPNRAGLLFYPWLPWDED